VREGFYSGTVIHRAVANFVIQGGGHDATSYALRATHENVFKRVRQRPAETSAAPWAWHAGMRPTPATRSFVFFFYLFNLVDNPTWIRSRPLGLHGVRPHRAGDGRHRSHRRDAHRPPSDHSRSDAPLKAVIIEKMEMVAAGATSSAPVITPLPPRQDTILSPK